MVADVAITFPFLVTSITSWAFLVAASRTFALSSAISNIRQQSMLDSVLIDATN